MYGTLRQEDKINKQCEKKDLVGVKLSECNDLFNEVHNTFVEVSSTFNETAKVLNEAFTEIF